MVGDESRSVLRHDHVLSEPAIGKVAHSRDDGRIGFGRRNNLQQRQVSRRIEKMRAEPVCAEIVAAQVGGDDGAPGNAVSASTASRLIAPAGTVALTGGSLELALGSGVTVAGMRATGPQSYTIIDAANSQLSGTFSTTNFTNAGFAASEWTVAYNPGTGNASLNFTPVPEPATVLGLAAAMLLTVRLIWNRFARRAMPACG
jgi:hypothetical protein